MLHVDDNVHEFIYVTVTELTVTRVVEWGPAAPALHLELHFGALTG